MFACEYSFSKADPWPLKTYVDYNMEPGNKPEESVDPIAQLVETLGSIRSRRAILDTDDYSSDQARKMERS